MSEAIKQSDGHFGVAEDIGPFGEAQVGGDDHVGAFVEFGKQLTWE
jgi:hypothetical protein